jgi:hypothetical protein
MGQEPTAGGLGVTLVCVCPSCYEKRNNDDDECKCMLCKIACEKVLRSRHSLAVASGAISQYDLPEERRYGMRYLLMASALPQ